MNVGEIKTALKAIANVDDTDPLLTWINAAYHEFERAFEWPFLEVVTTIPLVVGTPTVALPADFQTLQSIRVVGQAFPLGYIGRRQYEYNGYDSTLLGLPTLYTMDSSAITLYPVPDIAYNLRISYVKFLNDLAADANVPAIPVAYHYPLAEGAAGYALGADSEEDRVNSHRQIFLDSISEAIGKYSVHQNAEYATVRDVMDYH